MASSLSSLVVIRYRRRYQTGFPNPTCDHLICRGTIYVNRLHQRLERGDLFFEPSRTCRIKEDQPMELCTLLPGDRREAILFKQRQPCSQPVCF